VEGGWEEMSDICDATASVTPGLTDLTMVNFRQKMTNGSFRDHALRRK
jgi:hypothetical protein